ncbi:UNVERIFIED_CONTAM: Retrovirus-related Pol polyprotein from transposon RE1 [Sesamum indicum]
MEEKIPEDDLSMRLQGNENPSMSLVSAQFNGNNYMTWARSVKIGLGAKQKLGYINGSYAKPTEDKEAIERWQRNDYMVVSWILSSMSKEIAEAFLYTNSAKDLWTDLETRFGESNGPLLYQLQRKITSITQKSSTIAVYFTKLKKLWDELGSLDPLPVCTCGASKRMSEKIASQQLIQFLMGLGDTYKHVKNQIILIDPLPTAAKACSMVHRIEKQMQVNSEISEVEREGVMAVQVTEIKGKGNVKINSKKGTTLDKKHLQCEHCKKRGHLEEDFHGYAGITTTNTQLWIIDSGASAHICNSLTAFKIVHNLDNLVSVKLPNGNSQDVKITGEVHITENIILKNVLYVPAFNHNLLSVSKLCRDDNLHVHFTDQVCVVQDPRTRDVLAIGHTSLDVLKQMKLCKETTEDMECKICPLAKQHRMPFSLSESCTKSVFELIHMDVWGPYRKHSVNNYEYMLTIVDDFNRSTWTYLMLHKSQTLSKLKQFYNMVSTQFDVKIKQVRTDNGTEFVNKECQDFFHSKGIVHRRTCVYTPEQNGVVERKHQHLLKIARSLMFQANMPLKFWTDSLLMTTYLVNRLPIKTLKWKSPYELLYKVKPAYDHIKEPRNFKEAQGKEEWEKAMQEELNALAKNKTLKIADLPTDKKAIGCKWLYKVKLNPNGTIERYKARLVAKGYSQVEGEDYNDCFALVAKAVTVRIFLAVAVRKQWPLHHLDVNNAFLHGYLDEDIYMEPPQGYEIPKGKVCKLEKSLYGLKQASRKWNEEFTTKVSEFGFVQCSHDHCLFVKGSGLNLIALLVYVDDILITSACEDSIMPVKDYLDKLFTVKHFGSAKYFLGLEMARSAGGMVVSQHKYAQDIVDDVKLSKGRHVTTSLLPGLKLTKNTGAELTNPSKYRRLVGRLLLGCLPIDKEVSDRLLCVHGRGAISWKTKKQTTVARFSAEAEYRCMAATTCEVTWLIYILKNMGVEVKTPIPFYCDNKAALHITANPVFHERTKNLEIDCHIVRNKYKEGIIQPTYVVSKQQIADLFTKPLCGNSFLYLKSKLYLLNLHPSLTCEGGDEIQRESASYIVDKKQ